MSLVLLENMNFPDLINYANPGSGEVLTEHENDCSRIGMKQLGSSESYRRSKKWGGIEVQFGEARWTGCS